MRTVAAPAAPPLTAPAGRVERYETIVVGAGQAGLAVGHELARRDADFAILTDERRVGDNWRRRWDSLRLFTPAARSGLPGMPFPAPPSHLPDKDDVADYLERYAERFDLPVRLGAGVASLDWDGERWVADAGGVRVEADSVVVATGAFQRPRVPAVAARLDPRIHQLHSSGYRNPWALPDGPALVVGAGNSGAQIALELAAHRPVWLAGRDTGHLPRRLLGRDLFEWLWPVMTRATVDTGLGRRLRERGRRGDALIGIPERLLRDAGVRRVGRLDEARDGRPVCGDEARRHVAVPVHRREQHRVELVDVRDHLAPELGQQRAGLGDGDRKPLVEQLVGHHEPVDDPRRRLRQDPAKNQRDADDSGAINESPQPHRRVRVPRLAKR